MKTRNYKDTEEAISLLGFGCMRFPKLDPEKEDIDEEAAMEMLTYAYENGVNYFDTANPYHGGMSETFMGKAMKKFPRESFKLATKMPPWRLTKEEDVEAIFQEQLEKCQVEYFDFYLMHALDEEKFDVCERFHVYEFLTRMKEEGKIRHLGFSFHAKPQVLEKIVSAHDWDFVQIQLNYLDWTLQDAKRQYEILKEHGIPVVVMEPVRGGALASLSEEAGKVLKEAAPDKSLASWAIRYAASLPNVLTVLSGMSDFDQVKDNISTMSDFKPLSREEYELVEKAKSIYFSSGTIPCTGCRYCMDCPAGVDIPKVFSIYNQHCIDKNDNGFKTSYEYMEESKRASHCVDCKKCMEHCPQAILIPERMREIDAFAGELLSKE